MWFQLGKKGLTSKQVHDENVGLGGGGSKKSARFNLSDLILKYQLSSLKHQGKNGLLMGQNPVNHLGWQSKLWIVKHIMAWLSPGLLGPTEIAVVAPQIPAG